VTLFDSLMNTTMTIKRRSSPTVTNSGDTSGATGTITSGIPCRIAGARGQGATETDIGVRFFSTHIVFINSTTDVRENDILEIANHPGVKFDVQFVYDLPGGLPYFRELFVKKVEQ